MDRFLVIGLLSVNYNPGNVRIRIPSRCVHTLRQRYKLTKPSGSDSGCCSAEAEWGKGQTAPQHPLDQKDSLSHRVRHASRHLYGICPASRWYDAWFDSTHIGLPDQAIPRQHPGFSYCNEAMTRSNIKSKKNYIYQTSDRHV